MTTDNTQTELAYGGQPCDKGENYENHYIVEEGGKAFCYMCLRPYAGYGKEPPVPMTNTQTEGERREWEITEARVVERYPQHLNMHIISQQGDAYSPDRVWHVFGDGAAKRLRDYLNALESAASRGDRAEEALLNVRRFLDYVDLIGTGGRDEQVIRDEQELASLIKEIDDFEREKGGGSGQASSL